MIGTFFRILSYNVFKYFRRFWSTLMFMFTSICFLFLFIWTNDHFNKQQITPWISFFSRIFSSSLEHTRVKKNGEQMIMKIRFNRSNKNHFTWVLKDYSPPSRTTLKVHEVKKNIHDNARSRIKILINPSGKIYYTEI